MTTYVARMMDAETGAEGIYKFDADSKLIKKSPVKMVRAFMEHVDKDIFPRQHVDYELNVAFKNKHYKVVTAMGKLEFEDDAESVPFMLMISREKDEPEED